MEENDILAGQKVYNDLCAMLKAREWNFDKDDEKLVIRSGISGEDLPIEFIMRIIPKSQIVQYISWMPFKMAEEKRVEGAIAVCAANYGLIDGSFDYDITDGSITFRLTSSYRGSTLGDDLFEYMIMVASGTVDNYNDKFLMISKGVLTVEQFIKGEKG